ncbi:translocation/assembly module TamB domain-containing protein [candidate division KSB1 bacterium]|nr:translocation/assembly module TamB domain-containing protein [candidate division KSB1 bacterium]
MKQRKWVLVLASIVALLIVSIYTFWGSTGINEKLRKRILTEIEPFVDPQSEIGSVEFDLSSLHLRQVHLISKDQMFDLQISEMKLGYNLIDLIRFGFSPEKVANQVLLVHPRLTIHPIFPSMQQDLVEENLPLMEIRKSFGIIQHIDQIAVVDAEIHIENQQNRQICMANSLDGILLSTHADSAIVRMDGNLFESEQENLHLEGAVNLITRLPIRMTFTLDESTPSPELPLFLPSFVQVTEGTMVGQGAYSRTDGATGFFELREGTFSFQNAAFILNEAAFRADLKSRNIQITGRIGDFNGSPINVSGTIQNFWNPKVDLKAESDSFYVHHFFHQAMPNLHIPVSGQARIDLQMIGSLNQPELIGSITSRSLDTPVMDLERFKTSVWLKNRHLTIRSESVHPTEGSAIRLDGDMQFSDSRDPMIRAELKLSGPFSESLPEILKRRLEKVDSDLHFLVYGSFSNPEGHVNGSMRMVSKSGEVLLIQPEFEYKDHTCTGEITTDQNLLIRGSAEHVLTDDYMWQLDGEHLESVLNLVLSNSWRERWGRSDISASATAKQADWRVEFDSERQLPGDEIERLSLSAQSESDKSRFQIHGTYRVGEGPVARLQSRMHITQKQLTVEQFRANRFLTMDAEIPFQDAGLLRGTVELDAMPAYFLRALYWPLNAIEGDLDGQIDLAGTVHDPELIMDIALREGTLFENGVFEGELIAMVDQKGLNRLSTTLRRNDIQLITGEVKRDIETDSLSGQFTGREIQLGKDQIRILPQRDWLQGEVNLDVSLSGLSMDPIVKGTLHLGSGHIGPLAINEAFIELEDRTVQNDTMHTRVFFIQNGYVQNPDGLELSIQGSIPHQLSQDANIQLIADGNLFAPLTASVPFFVRGNVNGHLEMRLAGEPGAWILGSLETSFSEGVIETAAFFPVIQEIEGALSLQSGDRFVKIHSLSGKIDGGLLRLSNIRAEDSPVRLYPLRLDTLRLDLGILRIETPERGIVASIPGLMESGDMGRFRFSGLASDEMFTVSGPVESPHIRGIFLLEDQRFTYPFHSGVKGEETSRFLNKLAVCSWDVKAVPTKDVHYVRSYLTPLGNVYLDLQLRESFGDLKFQGTPEGGDFEIWGTLASTEGTLDVLDYYFRPEQITFDYPKGVDSPILSGRAYTTVIDSLGIPSTVWLTITTLDKASGAQSSGGALDQIYFRFETDNPNLGRTEADLLAAMGYSESSMKDRAYDALGLQVENMVFRPIFRPIERQIRRHLGLDIVRVSSMFSRNLMQSRTSEEPVLDPKWLLRSTKLTLGKYVAPGFFITYSGQVQNDMGVQYTLHGLGFRHALALEYSIRPDLFLEMEYTYDSQLFLDRREDKKIWLRHIFPF